MLEYPWWPLKHEVNQIRLEELYGLDWARPVHWSELPKFLRLRVQPLCEHGAYVGGCTLCLDFNLNA